MRRSSILVLGLLSALAVASCARKQEAAQQESTVDSLLASNPSEQGSGNLTPQTEYQEPAPKQAEPAPAPPRRNPASTRTTSSPKPAPGVAVPAGTAFTVAVMAKITSETAQPGDTWTGSVKDPVIVGDHVAIPAGSAVTGVVTGVQPAQKGSRAVLVLAIKSVEIDGKSHALSAGTDSLIAGSTRARNVGAVAGGAAAGALIGKVIGGSSKGALIGGLIGGATATGAVVASKGYQAEVKEGAEMTFSVNERTVINK